MVPASAHRSTTIRRGRTRRERQARDERQGPKEISIAIAWRTLPIMRTRWAVRQAQLSSAGRPKSLTSVAPGAENRSVIWEVIAASCTVPPEPARRHACRLVRLG